MERYISKQEQILRPASTVYAVLSNLDNLTPALHDKVDGWQATADTCSFKVKGFPVHLRIVEREEPKLIKITGDEGASFDFAFWLQLVPVEETDTRIRIVLDVKLNAMMKMMVGKKLAHAVDQIAQTIAESFNNAPI